MGIYEDIVAFLKAKEESGVESIDKDEIYNDLGNKYSSDELDRAFETERNIFNMIKFKKGKYRLSANARRYYFPYLKENNRQKYKNIEDFILSRWNHWQASQKMLQNTDTNNEITKMILKILNENGNLNLSQIIAEIATITNKKHGDPYLFSARNIVSKMVAQKLIRLENKKYSIEDLGKSALNSGEEIVLTQIYEPKNNKELKDLVQQGVDLSAVSIAFMDNLNGIFANFKGNLSGIENWDTSNVIGMKAIFKGVDLKNIDLSSWDISNVSDLSMAFMGAKNIKGIEEWETKSLENMDKIFKDCKDFNANLSNWRTERLKSINSAFENASEFNGAVLNDLILPQNFDADNAFKGAKTQAEWAINENVSHEFYIYKLEKNFVIPNDFILCQDDITLKDYLNSGISWLRSEIVNEFKFYFKTINQKRKIWDLIIEIFDLKFLITTNRKTDDKSVAEEFKIFLEKLELDEINDTLAEEEYVNPYIRLIKTNSRYSVGQNNDDIYFGYKGIFVDSKRFSLAMRTMILYILARAYREKLEGYIKNSAQKGANLAKINEEACKFNLEKYFMMPVVARDGALQAGIWTKIYDLYDIDDIQAQITEKISTMANILAEKRAKRQQILIAVATMILTIFAGILPMLLTR
ncbi:MAG: BspA family leucine-rich repeat surface protein [Campylobacter sp.]|nr:BspA family leucine-rich repeat surface protein [Campylobacter sp.]